MELYKNIKQIREELGMSQEELALRIGYRGKTSICHIENGEQDLPLSKIEAIASALHVPPSVLMGWADDAAPEPLADTLALLRQLDDVDQQKAAAYVEGLLAADKYQKRKEKSIG